jgi:hypothetical protein
MKTEPEVKIECVPILSLEELEARARLLGTDFILTRHMTRQEFEERYPSPPQLGDEQ